MGRPRKRRGLMRGFPYVIEDVDRAGNVRIYVRIPGRRKVRLRERPGTPEFVAAYETALGAAPPPPMLDRASSFGSLVKVYLSRSGEYKHRKPATKIWRRQTLEAFCDSRLQNGTRRGDLPFSRIEPHHIRQALDEMANTPHQADKMLKSLRRVLRYACEMKMINSNPAADVSYFRKKSDGFHTWTETEVAQYVSRHPKGTIPYLALALLLFTGQRRSDVVRMGPQHVCNGNITVTQGKTGKRLVLPVLSQLAEAISATPCGHLTYLTTAYGKPFTSAGFGNRFRNWCDQAGLHHCTAHGLRKAGATFAAEQGVTTLQLMAIFGFTIDIAETYVRKADQKTMAREAMGKLVPLISPTSPKWD